MADLVTLLPPCDAGQQVRPPIPENKGATSGADQPDRVLAHSLRDADLAVLIGFMFQTTCLIWSQSGRKTIASSALSWIQIKPLLKPRTSSCVL